MEELDNIILQPLLSHLQNLQLHVYLSFIENLGRILMYTKLSLKTMSIMWSKLLHFINIVVKF